MRGEYEIHLWSKQLQILFTISSCFLLLVNHCEAMLKTISRNLEVCTGHVYFRKEITSHAGSRNSLITLAFPSRIHAPQINFGLTNTHAKISACALADNKSINPKQCKKWKLSSESWCESIDRANKCGGNNNFLIQSLRENAINAQNSRGVLRNSSY